MRILTAVGILLMAASVPLLIHGLYGPTIKYTFHVKIFGQSFPVIERERTLIGENGLVQWLWNNNSLFGAFFLVFFGILIPLVKYAVFGFWISGLGCRSTANWALCITQRLSKWAAVDAVCSAIVVGMLLKLPGASAHHDSGYLSFIMYCIFSSLAFYCLPGELEADDPNPTPLNLAIAAKLTSPRARASVLVISVSSFLMLLTLAGGSHTVHMWVPKEVMRDNVDDMIKKYEAGVEDRVAGGLPYLGPRLTPQLRDQIRRAAADLPDIDSRVSVSGCISRLLHSTHRYSIYGSLVLFVCIVFLPVVYAVLTAAKALSMTEWNEFHSGSHDPLTSIPEDHSVKGTLSPWHGIDKFRSFARDLSMLDVLAVGLVVGYLVTQDEDALRTGLEPQFLFLVFAAMAWHFHNFLCACIQASAHCEYNKEPEAEDRSLIGSTGGVY
jgi:uncharacterized paraquat-inducible protein A